MASWTVSQRALTRSHGVRTELEDTVVRPDGRKPRRRQPELVRAAAAILV